MNAATTESMLTPGGGIAGHPFVMIAEDDAELRGLLAETLVEDGCVAERVNARETGEMGILCCDRGAGRRSA